MTAPVQEPNDQRALQGLAYQRDQLLRRPAIISPDGPGYPFIYREQTLDSPLTILANDNSNIQFDFTDDASAAGYFTAVSVTQTTIDDQGTDTKGIYRFTAGAKWDTPWTGTPASIAISCTDFGWNIQQTYEEPDNGAGAPLDTAFAMFINFVSRVSTTNTSTVTLIVGNGDSSDQVLLQAFLEIAYLGTWDGTAPDTFQFPI